MRSAESLKAEFVGRAFDPTAKLMADLKAAGVDIENNSAAATAIGEWAGALTQQLMDMFNDVLKEMGLVLE